MKYVYAEGVSLADESVAGRSSELVAQISAVTSDDIGRVASSLLKSPPSVVVVGDTTSVPRYDQVAKMLA